MELYLTENNYSSEICLVFFFSKLFFTQNPFYSKFSFYRKLFQPNTFYGWNFLSISFIPLPVLPWDIIFPYLHWGWVKLLKLFQTYRSWDNMPKFSKILRVKIFLMIRFCPTWPYKNCQNSLNFRDTWCIFWSHSSLYVLQKSCLAI